MLQKLGALRTDNVQSIWRVASNHWSIGGRANRHLEPFFFGVRASAMALGAATSWIAYDLFFPDLAVLPFFI